MRLEIIKYPDKRLSEVAEEVEEINAYIIGIAHAMQEKLREVGGLGLSAPQIGVNKRIIVLSDDLGFPPKVLINPKYTDEYDTFKLKEVCLSVPGVAVEVKRNRHMLVSWVTLSGKNVVRSVSDLDAVVIQHEIDHLNGVTLMDRLYE